MMPKQAWNAAGLDMSFAPNLVGHHALTMGLLKEGMLSDDARIIFVGSEAARGDVMGMSLPDFAALAKNHDGNLAMMFDAVVRGTEPKKYNAMSTYAAAKLMGAWWVAALAQRLPRGITVNAISPGNTLSTNFAQHLPWIMRKMMFMMMTVMGQSQDIAAAGKRLVDGVSFPPEKNGLFFASAPGRLVGPMQVQEHPRFGDKASQSAVWEVLSNLGGALPS